MSFSRLIVCKNLRCIGVQCRISRDVSSIPCEQEDIAFLCQCKKEWRGNWAKKESPVEDSEKSLPIKYT